MKGKPLGAMWATRAPYILLLLGWAPISTIGLRLYSERFGLFGEKASSMFQDPAFFVMFVVACLGTALLLANCMSPQWQLSATFSRPNLGRLLVTILLTSAAWATGWAVHQALLQAFGPPGYVGLDLILVVPLQFLFLSPIFSVVLFEILEKWKTATTRMGGRYLYCFVVTNIFGPALILLLLLDYGS